MQRIIHSDCLEEMQKMTENSIDCIVTDPPYGLSFMGKHWDHGIPGVDFWKEAVRICKPGSHMLAFGGTRTYHRLACAIEDAGWEIRDCLMWVYGSGFPKIHNFGRKISEEWKGYGTALKPAYEPILLCMKPLEGTFIQNAEKWGIGGVNIDGCRVQAGSDLKSIFSGSKGKKQKDYGAGTVFGNSDKYQSNVNIKGRWPANIIFDEESAAELDEMTGVSKSTGGQSNNALRCTQNIYGKGKSNLIKRDPGYGDVGGASRFFYCAKASSTERNRGLEGMPLKEMSGCYGEFEGDGRGRQTEHLPRANNHPTVKPISLMKYLVKLVAPPGNATILDPFAGSGTTLLAAKELGINAIGIEKEAEYVEIAEKRLENWFKPDPEPEQYLLPINF